MLVARRVRRDGCMETNEYPWRIICWLSRVSGGRRLTPLVKTMPHLIQDFRFAFRMLRRSPAFTGVAILSLALGIGANTAIFSVMDALLLRTLPVKQPKQLVLFGAGLSWGIFNPFPNGDTDLFSQPFFHEVRAKNNVFSDVAAVESMRDDVHARFEGVNAGMEPIKIRLVSGNYFSILGVGASAGRVLMPEDDQKPGGHPVAVMSHAFWERRFPGNVGVIGRKVTLNATVYTIIGVAAREFFGTVVGESPDFWIPLAMQAQVEPWLGDPFGAQSQSLWVFGRLKPGVSAAVAEANTNIVFQQWLHAIAGESPSAERFADMRKACVKLTEAENGISRLRREFSRSLEILMVLVGLVLLIACANIANLLLARAAGRQREIAVRAALGAARRRLIGQFLSESLLLALIGGTAGVLMAWWGGQLLLAMVSSGPEPVPLEAGPNGRALVFTFGISLLTGLLFGIVPALRMTKVDLGPSLKEGKGMARASSRGWLGQALVAGQVAVALFLTIGAGLFVRTLQILAQTRTGFDRDRVVLLQLDNASSNIKDSAVVSLSRRLEARVRALPGVQAASFSMLTFNEGQWVAPLWPEGVEHTEANGQDFQGNRVGAQYFEVLGTPIVMGRSFGPQDTPQSQRVAVINETLARKLYPEASPLGRHFALAGRDKQDFEIVGVVKDAKYNSVHETPRGMWFVYAQQEQSPDSFNDLVVRVTGKPEALVAQIRAAIRDEDPNLAISEVTTLAEIVDRSFSQEKLLAKLASFFGALALLLASVGLYGIMAYSVARRTNEIGIRMALGARPGSVLRMVLSESLIVVALGLVVGIPAALACGRLVSSQLYGLKANDPLTIAAAAAVLLVVALVAVYLPARRAALLDPLAALRQE
jgi:predicted permease